MLSKLNHKIKSSLVNIHGFILTTKTTKIFHLKNFRYKVAMYSMHISTMFNRDLREFILLILHTVNILGIVIVV